MYWLIIALILVPQLVHSEAVVCGITATTGKFSRFLPSADLSRFVAGSTETCNHIRGDAATAQQIDLYNTVPVRHIKVVLDTLVHEAVQPLSMAQMTQSEKDTVDAAISTEVGKKQAWKAETNTPGVCKYNSPDEIDTKVDQVKTNNIANIDGTTFSEADKQQLRSLSNRLTEAIRQVVTCDAARAGGG